MKKLTKILLPMICLLTLSVTGSVNAENSKQNHNKYTAAAKTSHMPAIRILPEKVSRNLEILRAPTTEPIPLIVGFYWSCFIDSDTGLESCDPRLVICTNDQSVCAEH